MQRRDILKTLLLLGVTTSSPLVNAIEAGLSDRKLNAVEFSDSQRQAVQIARHRARIPSVPALGVQVGTQRPARIRGWPALGVAAAATPTAHRLD